MRYYILAGELSGDQHGAELIRAIKSLDPKASFRGMAGDACAAEGMEIQRHYNQQNVMGFSEILRHLPKLLRFLKESQKDLLAWKPDVVIPIDYPGFNLRMAKFAHRHGFPVDYFIPPQVWAWHSSRALKLKAYCRQIFCILPFEPTFYAKYGVKATYVGNPLMRQISFIPIHERDRRTLLLMPGSRPMEIKKMLPVMLKAASQLDEFEEVVVAGLEVVPKELYTTAKAFPKVKVVFNETEHWLKKAGAAFITSGTATLEGALAGIPLVVCYKGHPLSVAIAKRLINVPFISLVNLIGNQGIFTGEKGEAIVKECIQEACEPDRLVSALRDTLANTQVLMEKYAYIRSQLGDAVGIEQAAKGIVHNSSTFP
jgi:lipid-A-disaccharide synthase